MKEEQLKKALEIVESKGLSWRKAAKSLGVAKSTLSDALRAHYKRLEGQGSTMVAGSDENLTTGLVGPSILLIDLETSPCSGWVWSRFKQYLSQEQVESESFILSYAYKWLGEPTIGFGMGTKGEIKEESDERLVREINELLTKADIVIGHNLCHFDDKVIKTRMLYWGLNPPSSYKKVDTLQIAKTQFRFPSNKLDSIGQYLNIGQKLGHEGFSLWKKVLQGDNEARATMEAYNIQDVALLEEVYLKLRAWDNKSPNAAQYYEDTKVRCPCCGSENLRKTRKKVYSPVSEFDEMECKDCGKKSRTRKSTFTREKTAAILSNVI